jgi:hypothetical protein
MLQATIYEETIGAGLVSARLFSGAYFNILSATGPIDIRTDKVNLKGLTAGQGFEKQPFTRLELTDASGASNVIRYVIADEGFLAGLTGNMTISSIVPVQSGSFAVTAPALTTGSTVAIAANTARKYLMIENNDPAAFAYINFGAPAVVGAAAVRIGPGENYEMNTVQSTQAIHWIGSAASALMTVVQG